MNDLMILLFSFGINFKTKDRTVIISKENYKLNLTKINPVIQKRKVIVENYGNDMYLF